MKSVTDSEIFYEDEERDEFYTLVSEGEFISLDTDLFKKCLQCGKMNSKNYCSQECREKSHRTFRRD